MRACPRWLGLNCWAFWGLLLCGAGVGFAGNWWLNRPWMEFESLSATYESGPESSIMLNGIYAVNWECRTPVSWYQEAIATDGQIAQYGPLSGPPDLTKGRHEHRDKITLTAEIFPDGWKVTIIARCGSQTITSPSVPVIIVEDARS